MSVNEIRPTGVGMNGWHFIKEAREVRKSARIGYDHFHSPDLSDIIMIRRDEGEKFLSPKGDIEV